MKLDLWIARMFHWKYEWVAELPCDVYDVLLDELTRELEHER